MGVLSILSGALIALLSTPVLTQNTNFNTEQCNLAANSSHTNSLQYTVSTLSEVTALGPCRNITGDIIISPDYDNDTLDFGGLLEIDGSLLIQQVARLKHVNFPELWHVSGTLFITGNPNLTTVNLGVTSVGDAPDAKGLAISENGNIGFLDLSLQGDFPRDVSLGGAAFNLPNITSVEGAMNLLGSRDNISFSKLTSVDSLWIQNTTLRSFNAPQLEAVNSDFRVDNNSNLPILSLPALQYVGGILDINQNNLTNFTAPKLGAIGEGMNVAMNPQLEQIHFPALEHIGSICCGIIGYITSDRNLAGYHAINISNNAVLQNVSMPALSSIGADLEPETNPWNLTVTENLALTTFDGLPDLQTVNGSVYIKGNFTSIRFSALTNVSDNFIINSTANLGLDCTVFNALNVLHHAFGGRYSCTTEPIYGSPTPGGPEWLDGDDKGLSKGAKAGIGIGVTIFAILLIGAVIFAFMRWGKRRRGAPVKVYQEDGYSMPEIPNADEAQLPPHLKPQPAEISLQHLAGRYQEVGSPYSSPGRDVSRELDRGVGESSGSVSPPRGRETERKGGDYRDVSPPDYETANQGR